MKRRNASFIVYSCHINCLLKHIIEGKRKRMIKVIGRRGRRHKQLLNDLQKERYYCKLKEEALDRPPWTTCFGRRYGPLVRKATY